MSFLLVEILLRLAGVEYNTFIVPDPDLGWALRPGAEGWYRFEGEARVRINSAGFRGPEFPLEKPKDVYRVAVLGDSFTVALDVPEEKTFLHVLKERMQASGKLQGRRVEVLNFGVGGYGTTQELLMLRTRALRYQPDLVLLMFFAGNDVSDNSREARQSMTAHAPFLLPERNGGWRLDYSFRNASNLWLRVGGDAVYYSRLAQVVNQVRKVSELRKLQALPATVGREEGNPNDPVMQRGWRATDQLLGMIQADCRKSGAGFLAGIIPMPAAILPDSNVVADPSKVAIDSRFEALCKARGIDAVALFAPMARYATQHKAYLCGFPKSQLGQGHWNEVGHRVAGEALAEAIGRRFDGTP